MKIIRASQLRHGDKFRVLQKHGGGELTIDLIACAVTPFEALKLPGSPAQFPACILVVYACSPSDILREAFQSVSFEPHEKVRLIERRAGTSDTAR